MFPLPRIHIESMSSKVCLNEASPFEGLESNGRANTSCTVRHFRLIRSRIRQRPASLRKIKTQIQAFSSADFAVDWPLQAGLFGLLFSYACFLQRPRGWADSDLTEVCMKDLIKHSSETPIAGSHPERLSMYIALAGQRFSSAWQVFALYKLRS